ncbi:MAG: hypothetical protein LUK37_13510 [Clostridia bacterium]|nr:hypothetical protein [Clostridia bacterium]
MKILKEKTWQFEKSGADGNVQLFGVNIFDYHWETTGKRAAVTDPLYGQEFIFNIYTVVIGGDKKEFAAGEFSNCVWGFYLYH